MPNLIDEIKALRDEWAHENPDSPYKEVFTGCANELTAILSRHAPQKVERWRCAHCKTYLNEDKLYCADHQQKWHVVQRCGPVERVEE